MDPQLAKLLKETIVDESKITPTHYTYYGPDSKWEIDKGKLSEFWERYCALVQENTDNNETKANLCLAELPTNFMPVIGKFILTFDKPDDDEWEPYDNKFLQWIVHIYQDVIRENFHINSDSFEELFCIVLERKLAVNDGAAAEGSRHNSPTHHDEEHSTVSYEIRVQFPYANVEARYHNKLIRKKVIELLRKNNVTSKLSQSPIGDWETILSDKVTTEPLTMYGSSETPESEKLTVTHIWNIIDEDEIEYDDLIEEMEIDEVFDKTQHKQVSEGLIDEEIFDNSEITSWLPMFLSISFWSKYLIPKNKGTPVNAKPTSDTTFGDPKVIDDSDEYFIAQKMCTILSVHRFTKELFWLDIGKAFYNIHKNSDKGLQLWIKATNKALATAAITRFPDFMLAEGSLEDTCKVIYNSLNNTFISYKTLAWYAREDNPKEYAEWHKEWCRHSMETALDCDDSHVAEALYRVFWLEFACSSIKGGRWFHFHDHRWNENDSGVSLRRAISGSFRATFETARIQLNKRINESTDEGFKSKGEITNKKISALIAKLGKGAFKNIIMREAMEKFHNDKFLSMLDRNSELTGVLNGVLEVQGKQVVFRAAKPEDYVTMTTSVRYENLSYEHPLVKELLLWLNQTFPDEELRHHFCKFAASLLIGRNADKIFPIFTGENGDNSKSMIVKLFETTMGVYCIKFPVSMLTEKFMNSSGPNPQLARAKGSRVAFLDEPEDDVSLQKGTIKRYTGGDSFFARLLQDNGGDVEATFKMILVCNKVPVIPNADKAIKNRTRLFPFMSTWTNDAPEDPAEQMRKRLFKKDPNFEKRIPKLAPAFLWLMTEYFHIYASEGLPDPRIVTEYTDNYWRDNDVYAQFASEKIQEVFVDEEFTVHDTNAKLSLTELYAEFKEWFKINFPSIKVPQRTFVKAEYQHRWGKMVNNSWLGIKMVDDSVEEAIVVGGGAGKTGGIAGNAKGALSVTKKPLAAVRVN